MRKTARAIIIDNGKLLVFYRRKIINGEVVTYYAIPGGHLEDNETLEDTVVRELKEEMNLDIKILDYLGMIFVDNQEEYYYHCKIIGGDIKFGGEEFDRCNDDNYYEIRWVSVDEIKPGEVRAIDFVRRVSGVANDK